MMYYNRLNYFPIYENTQLKFNRRKFASSSMGGYSWENKAIWDIYKSEIIGENKVHYVKETIDNYVSYFQIIENLKENLFDKRITIKGLPDFNDIMFNPYIDPRRGEVVGLVQRGTSYIITLKKNLGLYKIEKYCGYHCENIIYERIE